MTGVLLCRDVKTQGRYREEGPVRTEAETGVILSQAKECQGSGSSQKLEKARKDSSLEPSVGRSMAVPTP